MASISSSPSTSPSLLLTTHSPHPQTPKPPHPTFKPKPKTPKFLSQTHKFSPQDAFPDSLPLHTQNPTTTYKHIQDFARQNKLTQALAILDYLTTQNIPINTTTFSSLIAACIRLKSLSHAKSIHAHVRASGLQNNQFVNTKLVHMYGACGDVVSANEVFDEMPMRSSVYSWNALLRGNVVGGGRDSVCDGVVETTARMRELGVEMNVYTFSCLIKGLAGSAALTQGLKTHGLLIKNGFVDGSIVLQTSLIDFYFKCKKVKLARQVFEEIPEADAVVWGAMISGFAHNGLCKEAVECFRAMVGEGFEPNSVLVTAVLPAIGEIRAPYLGKEIHAYAIKTRRYADEPFIQSGLIDMYCKCGNMGSGRQVFYGSINRNAVTWTTLISGYISNKRFDQALRSLIWMQQEGLKPDVVTIATVLPVCTELKALRQGKEIHAYVIKHGFLLVSVVTSLMVMYSRSECLDYCCKLFGRMERRNVISWTAMIDSYLKNHCLDEALAVFRSMQLTQYRPDSVAISRILKVCGENRVLKLGREIHGHVLKKDFVSIPFVSAEVIKMYGRCGEIEKAKLVFNANPLKGSMTRTAIIEAYGQNNMCEEALHLYDKMITNGFIPNHYTFQVLLSICDRAGFADDGCRIFNSMSRSYKIKPSEEHYDSIIGLLTRVGCRDELQRYVHMRASMV